MALYCLLDTASRVLDFIVLEARSVIETMPGSRLMAQQGYYQILVIHLHEFNEQPKVIHDC